MGGQHGKMQLDDVLPFFLKVFLMPNGSFLFHTQMSAEEIWKQEKYQEHVLNPMFTVLPYEILLMPAP